MKFYVVLAATVTLIIGSYFYMLHQDHQKLLQQQQSKTAELERMKAAALLAEQDEAAMIGKSASLDKTQKNGVNGSASAQEQALVAVKPGGLKRVKVAFEGSAPNMKRQAKKFDHFEEMYIGHDNEEGFKFSSAQYSHQKVKAERVGTQGNISDDLLIVESRLEDRAQR